MHNIFIDLSPIIDTTFQSIITSDSVGIHSGFTTTPHSALYDALHELSNSTGFLCFPLFRRPSVIINNDVMQRCHPIVRSKFGFFVLRLWASMREHLLLRGNYSAVTCADIMGSTRLQPSKEPKNEPLPRMNFAIQIRLTVADPSLPLRHTDVIRMHYPLTRAVVECLVCLDDVNILRDQRWEF